MKNTQNLQKGVSMPLIITIVTVIAVAVGYFIGTSIPAKEEATVQLENQSNEAETIEEESKVIEEELVNGQVAQPQQRDACNEIRNAKFRSVKQYLFEAMASPPQLEYLSFQFSDNKFLETSIISDTTGSDTREWPSYTCLNNVLTLNYSYDVNPNDYRKAYYDSENKTLTVEKIEGRVIGGASNVEYEKIGSVEVYVPEPDHCGIFQNEVVFRSKNKYLRSFMAEPDRMEYFHLTFKNGKYDLGISELNAGFSFTCFKNIISFGNPMGSSTASGFGSYYDHAKGSISLDMEYLAGINGLNGVEFIRIK